MNARTAQSVKKLLASIAALSLGLGLAGCGELLNSRGNGQGMGGGQWGGGSNGLGPSAPGNGGTGPSNTPNLGGIAGGNWGNTGQNPPQVGPLAPGNGATFSNDTNAILAKYNCRITGSDANTETVKRVTNALQLYKTRQHQMTVQIQQDDSKLPVAAMWTSDGYSALVYFYQPSMQHTINHEMAHDLTLMVDSNSGDRLTQTIMQSSGDQATWPSDYSQTNETEAMAEIVSFLAAIYARLPIDEQPFQSFNPSANIQQAAKVFMSPEVTGNNP